VYRPEFTTSTQLGVSGSVYLYKIDYSHPYISPSGEAYTHNTGNEWGFSRTIFHRFRHEVRGPGIRWQTYRLYDYTEVSGFRGNTWLMEADGDNPHPLLPPPPEGELIISRWKPRWSPDGKKLLYTEHHHTLAVLADGTHYIPQGYYYFICDREGKSPEAKDPRNLETYRS